MHNSGASSPWVLDEQANRWFLVSFDGDVPSGIVRGDDRERMISLENGTEFERCHILGIVEQ
jgi:hypothetical protein